MILYAHLIPELRALGTQRVPSLSCGLGQDLTRAPDAREEFPRTHSNKRHLIVSQLTALRHDLWIRSLTVIRLSISLRIVFIRPPGISPVNDEALLLPGKAGGLIEQGQSVRRL